MDSMIFSRRIMMRIRNSKYQKYLLTGLRLSYLKELGILCLRENSSNRHEKDHSEAR